MTSHYWPDGSGIAYDQVELRTWDSHGVLWVDQDLDLAQRRMVYEIFVDYRFSDLCDGLTGHICGDDETGLLMVDLHEIAYGLTYCGGGLESVSYRRLGELLASQPTLERVLEIIDVDLEQFENEE